MIIGIFLLYIQMYNIWDNDAISKLRIEIFSDCESCNAGSLGQEDPLEEEWQPTPVILPGEFHGQRSLAGYSPWGCKESGMPEQLSDCEKPYIKSRIQLD